MALQIWLPLTGNTKNIGINPITFSNKGATVNATGRIGSCYSFVKTSGIQADSNLTIDCSNLSYCFWFMITANPANPAYLTSLNNTGGMTDTAMGAYIATDGTLNVGANGSTYACTLGSNGYALNTWVHVACVLTSTGYKVYLNGDYVGTGTRTLLTRNHLAIGARSTNATTVDYGLENGKMNDFRLYDHCLSAKEVKEISRALTIHYLLNNNGHGPWNLLPDLGTWPSEGGVTKTQEPNSMWYKVSTTKTSSRWGSYINVTVEPDTTYTFSIDIKAGGKAAGVATQVSNVAITSWPAGTVSSSTTGYHYVKTFTTASDQTYLKIYLYHSSGTDTTLNYAYYARPKLEKGNYDTLYSIQEGIITDDNTIYDVSGYCHNGIKNGDLTITTPSPRYQSAMHFEAVLNTTWIKVPFQDVNKDRFYTFNVWFNKDKQSACPWDTIFGAGSGYELEMRTSSAAGGLNKIFLYSWGSKAVGTDEYTLNEWHMLTFCQDTTNTYVYLDGQLLDTSVSKDPVTGQYYLGAWSTRQNYQGYLSDMRIYCTCLSAEDVQELYNTSMAFDSNGNIIPRILS